MGSRFWNFIGTLIFVLLSALSPSLAGPSSDDEERVRMLINLMDYIAKDYPMAVQNGEVINAFEYDEMMEFSSDAVTYYRGLVASGTMQQDTSIESRLLVLGTLIHDKAAVGPVAKQAKEIRDKIMGLGLVSLAPLSWPNAGNGEQLYGKHCASCHGEVGDGRGPSAPGLEPPPTNFLQSDVMDGIAPLQAFNTITLGIEGTSMRAYNELSPEEVWDLAFYITGLQFATESKDDYPAIPLETVATKSNHNLRLLYPGIDIASVRLLRPETEDNALALARKLLTASQTAFESGDHAKAGDLALKAYLQGIEPIEPKIQAGDNRLFQKIESAMFDLRENIHSGRPEKVLPSYNTAFFVIDEVEEMLGHADHSIGMTIAITISILLREGLEAFFIILAMLGVLHSLGAQRAVRWVHGGWMLAVALGVVGWFYADRLMNWDAQNREFMEGIIALLAVVVLLYLGFWMHGKTSATKWKRFVEEKVKGLLSQNNMIGLASFSFLVVFREAFESVIFLSSLTADGESASSTGVAAGTLASAALLFAFAWAMLRWFKKMPVSKVFLYSSIAVLALAFVMSGKGIHALQEGGYIGIHSFPLNLKWSLIGLYPTYETVVMQLLVLAMIVLLWKISAVHPAKQNQT